MPNASGCRLPLFYETTPHVRNAYSEMLQSLPWDYFLTVTFARQRRDTIHTPRHVWQSLQQHAASRAFFAVEPHKLGGLHLHALVRHKGGPPGVDLPPTWAVQQGLRRDFGFSTAGPPRDPQFVASYCSKYVVKGNNDYQLYGAPHHWRPT